MPKKKSTTKTKTNKKSKKIRTMDVILAIIAIALTAFTIEMIVIFRETGTIPDTLCACVFTALGGECGAMAWIKTSKERRQDRKWAREDRNRENRLPNGAEDKEGTI